MAFDEVRELLNEISRLEAALRFYAKHEHWMALGGDGEGPRKLLIANGDTKSVEGWAVAEQALEP